MRLTDNDFAVKLENIRKEEVISFSDDSIINDRNSPESKSDYMEVTDQEDPEINSD